MMPGCVESVPPLPLASLADERTLVERIRARCPDVSDADRAELAARTAKAPAAPVSKAATRAWIDALEAERERKAAAGQRNGDALSACRSLPPAQIAQR